MTQIRYHEVGIEGLDMIQDLWKLLRLHVDSISDFNGQMEQLTFQERKEFLLEKSEGGNLRLDLARDPNNSQGCLLCEHHKLRK